MRRLSIALSLVTMLAAAGGSAHGGPTAGGWASDNVEYVGFVPFEVGTATGASLFGKYMVVTGWKTWSIYDISEPASPQLLSTTPFGFAFENEDVATNGEIMLFSEEAPRSVLHVWDIEDKSNPVEVATIEGAGNHTATCVYECRYSYGSDGAIVDLRNPAKAKLVGDWKKKLGIPFKVHDVDEFRPGYLVTSAYEGPIQLLDVRDPVHPRLVVSAAPPKIEPEAAKAGAGVHATRWPHDGNDRWLMAQGGSNIAQAQCNDGTRNFWTFDASRWESDGALVLRDEFVVGNGSPSDGRYPLSTCSTHWFDVHPGFRDGGLVTLAYYDNGTRFLKVTESGRIKEVGWFLPYAGVTSSPYWVTDELVYAIDYSRGLDILRFNP
ncbi:MAG: LVIVD repeat-containing protein [Actinomycetota bacterium]